GFLVNGALSLKRPDARGLVTFVGPAVLIGAFAVSVAAVLQMWSSHLEAPVIQRLWTWIPSGRLQIEFALQLDRLSAIMLLVVTGVGSLIHIFSVGYMKADESYARFFAYLNLFV